ncbi:MAG: hypothetical protein PHG63_01415 [Candidatus Dojkabacteria bacterium]|nr:hypothetical protein [Candidatus Dojkabacteria bacterium]
MIPFQRERSLDAVLAVAQMAAPLFGDPFLVDGNGVSHDIGFQGQCEFCMIPFTRGVNSVLRTALDDETAVLHAYDSPGVTLAKILVAMGIALCDPFYSSENGDRRHQVITTQRRASYGALANLYLARLVEINSVGVNDHLECRNSIDGFIASGKFDVWSDNIGSVSSGHRGNKM